MFEIRSVHLEPDAAPDAGLIADVAGAIRACAQWHATPRVVLRKADPADLGKRLRAALS
jgi:uncharacterized protein YcaQ